MDLQIINIITIIAISSIISTLIVKTHIMKIEVKSPELKIMPETKDTKLPTRAHDSDAGFDVYAPEDVLCKAGEDTLIPLGWRSKFNPSWAMIFKDKSGIATKTKLSICSGVIDSAYRGIVTVHFRNESGQDIKLYQGQKIAQFLICPVYNGQIEIVSELDETIRGEGGFGSTGVL